MLKCFDNNVEKANFVNQYQVKQTIINPFINKFFY